MGKVVLAFLMAFLVIGGVFLFKNEKINSLVSPIPKVFGTADNSEVTNSWFPNETVNADYSSLTLSAKSVILVDFDTGQIIYAKNQSEKLPAASTIKIMTALVALERAKPSDTFFVSEQASKVGENSMGLSAGEKLTLRELLYGLMLVSGNDAAITIAEGVARSEEEFVRFMNQYATDLGIRNTRFVNASGLDDDNRASYSTVYDLAVIAHYVWEKYPLFGEITSTYHQFIEASENHKAFDLYNDTNLLTTYAGVKGIKPGFTWEAGLCLVTYAQNNGKQLLAVILGSDDRRAEMKELLDYGFATDL